MSMLPGVIAEAPSDRRSHGGAFLARRSGMVGSRAVLAVKGENPAFSPLPIDPAAIQRRVSRRLPPVEACRELKCSVYQLILACQKARPEIQYPGLPPTVNDARAHALQRSLDGAPDAEAPVPSARVAAQALERETRAADEMARGGKPPSRKRQARTLTPSPAAVERRRQIEEAIASGERAADFCVRVGLSASALCWWVYNRRRGDLCWPGLPSPQTAGMRALQAEIDARIGNRVRAESSTPAQSEPSRGPAADGMPGRPTTADIALLETIARENRRKHPRVRQLRQNAPAVAAASIEPEAPAAESPSDAARTAEPQRAWLRVPFIVDGDRVFVSAETEWQVEDATSEHGRAAQEAIVALILGVAGRRPA